MFQPNPNSPLPPSFDHPPQSSATILHSRIEVRFVSGVPLSRQLRQVCCYTILVKEEMGKRILNDALRAIVNAERRGKSTVNLQPTSNVMSSFLNIMKYRGYIQSFEVHDRHRVGRIKVELQGRVNDCRALTYRQDLKAKDIEKFKTLKLPTRQWGYVVISTPEGILDHEEALRRNVGGQVLGYFH